MLPVVKPGMTAEEEYIAIRNWKLQVEGFRAIRKEFGFKRFDYTTARASFGTVLNEADVPSSHVSSMLGHSAGEGVVDIISQSFR